jgi:hypothetical protein
MPYRFSFNVAQGAGSYSGDPVISALDGMIHRAIRTQLLPLSVMLEEMMPILTDEEWTALPSSQQRYFEYTNASSPRPIPNHVPPRVLGGNFASGVSITEVPLPTRTDGDGAGTTISARITPEFSTDTLRIHRTPHGELAVTRLPRTPPPVVRRGRPTQTFTDTEPEDI